MKAKMVYIVAALVVVFAMAAALMPASPVLAQTTWYVDDDCTAPGTGTLADPFCKIQDAIIAASPDDTIMVAAGQYNEHDITINKSLVIQGAGSGNTIVDAGNSGGAFYINTSTVDMSGMTGEHGEAAFITVAD